MSKKNLRRGGFIAPYSSSPNSTEYMLNSSVNNNAVNNITGGPEIYIPPTNLSTLTSMPGIRGGKKNIELNDVFYYSMNGGCACNSGTSGGSYKSSKSRKGGNGVKKGGDIVLTPFISALALLGARMLADKNSGFNLGELMNNNNKPSSSLRGGVGCSGRYNCK
jgi:hypothetical protein